MMKNILFLICAFALFATGLPSIASAGMPNMECSHQFSDTASFDQDCADDQTQHHADVGECQDCCCIHSHVFAGTPTGISKRLDIKSGLAFEPHISLRSNDLSPLYRPPIV